jgi:hypothetical protein
MKLWVTCYTPLLHCSVLLWLALYQSRLLVNRPLSWKSPWTIFSVSPQTVYPLWLTGSRFGGNLSSLLDFGKAVIFTSFQDGGKCESRMHWLIKYDRFTNGFFGRYLNYLFGMSCTPRPSSILRNLLISVGARGSLVVKALILQTGRSRVRFPMRWIFKFT